MNRSVVFILSSDPRTSARPAEAVRIAAGIGAWKMVDVKLYFRGAALLALGEGSDELIDGDQFSQYLPIIGDFGWPVYAEKGSSFLVEVGEPSVEVRELTDRELAGLTAQSDFVARF